MKELLIALAIVGGVALFIWWAEVYSRRRHWEETLRECGYVKSKHGWYKPNQTPMPPRK
jgi:hypothetical protein